MENMKGTGSLNKTERENGRETPRRDKSEGESAFSEGKQLG